MSESNRIYGIDGAMADEGLHLPVFDHQSWNTFEFGCGVCDQYQALRYFTTEALDSQKLLVEE